MIDVEEFYVKYKNLYVAMTTHCYVVCQVVNYGSSRSANYSKRTVMSRLENIEISRFSKFPPIFESANRLPFILISVLATLCLSVP